MSIQTILVILISYLIGSLLPAELVSWVVKRKPCKEVGSGNPGFANIASSIGLFAGLLVLAGDVAKTYFGMRVAYDFTRGDTLLLTSLLSLCGLVVGHDFPLWNLFHGGKGVAVTCAGIIIITPTLGVPASLIGLVLILLTGYLPLGAISIPFSYLVMVWFLLPQAVPYALFLAGLMLIKNLPGLIGIFTGKCKKVRLLSYFSKEQRAARKALARAEKEAYLAEKRAAKAMRKAARAEKKASLAGKEATPAKKEASQTVEETTPVGTGADFRAKASVQAAGLGQTAQPDASGASGIPAEFEFVTPINATPSADKGSSVFSQTAPNSGTRERAAIWKTSQLPSLEELRAHRLRSKREIPETKSVSSPFTGARHRRRDVPSPDSNNAHFVQFKDGNSLSTPETRR